MNIKTTVIIPNFNGEKYIDNCLKSLQKQTVKYFEIIVIDDFSTDKSIELIKHYKNLHLIINFRNLGFAASVNKGIKNAKGEFVLLLNNDVVVENDFVEKLENAIMIDEKIFSVSSKMIRYYERDLIDDTGDFYNIFGWAYKRGDGKSITRLNKRNSIFSTCAGAGIYRKNIFDKIGLFDESFFAYMEDVDISYRGLINGYKNYYEPMAKCYHIGSATTAQGNKYSSFKVEISARNNVYVIYKNMPLLQLIINFPFLVIGFLSKNILFCIKGYGKEYQHGLWMGIQSIKKLKKTKFRMKNTLNYFKIQALLFINAFRYFKEKLI